MDAAAFLRMKTAVRQIWRRELWKRIARSRVVKQGWLALRLRRGANC
jgi:hypothetical protein